MHRIKFWVVLTLSFGMLMSACASGRSDRSEIVLTAEAAEETAESQPSGSDTAADQAEAPPAPAPEPVKPEVIVVHVCGAVNREGVYTLDAGSRVYEAVAAAGGFAQGADEAYINQAEVLTDGVRLRIPTRAETEAAAEVTAQAQAPVPEVLVGGAPDQADTGGMSGGKININTADAETLCRLSGVGESTAAKIIAWREANGGFSRIEDIMQVSGIKEKLVAKIKDDITV